jgi:hypothetical protein
MLLDWALLDLLGSILIVPTLRIIIFHLVWELVCQIIQIWHFLAKRWHLVWARCRTEMRAIWEGNVERKEIWREPMEMQRTLWNKCSEEAF